ncbi:MAG: galactose oxidase-like domain-containing protein [Actinomycetota bacterium]
MATAFAATVIAIAATVFSTPSSAAAEGSYLRIVPQHSRLCLSYRTWTPDRLAAVTQEGCTGGRSERFTVAGADPGYVEIRSHDQAWCLAPRQASTYPATDIVPERCNEASHQHFVLEPLGDGWSRVVGRASGLCLAISTGQHDPGAIAVQDHCDGGEDQRFAFEEISGASGELGLWSPVIHMPLIPVAAAALPDGKVLVWSANNRSDFGDYYRYGYTQTAIFDPATGRTVESTVAETGHDMFCPGIANLPDGRIFVNGGSSAYHTSIFNPVTGMWEESDAMNIPRGYQGTTLMSDGSAFTLGGSFSGGEGGKDAEVWTEGEGWRRLPAVTAEPFTGDDQFRSYRGDNHQWLFGWTENRVFHAGPVREMHWIETDGDGWVEPVGPRGDDDYAMNGTAVMYEPGKILTLGGAPNYDWGEATANATIVDIGGDEVTARTIEPMIHRRGFHNTAVLPNGEVVITGGAPVTGVFEDVNSVFETEIWNPATEQFRAAAPHAVPRNYHSFSLLLPDGRVLIGGGGLCGDCTTNHPDVEIFTPPYLLDDDGVPVARPAIVEAPASIDLGQTFEVRAEPEVEEFVLIRMSSATHSLNNDQRRIPVDSTRTGDGAYRVQAPDTGGVAIPGLYFLFGLDADGVPTEAAIVTITGETAR